MSGFWIPLLAGAATGVLSAWGIGGGTLLLLVMTLLRRIFGIYLLAAGVSMLLPSKKR